MAEDSYDALVERVDEALSVMERDENLGMELPIDVLQADPEHFYALSVLSRVLLGRGDYAPAAQAAQRLIDRYPDDDLGYFRMATVLLEEKKYEEAERYAEEAVSRTPMTPTISRGWVTLVSGRTDSRRPRSRWYGRWSWTRRARGTASGSACSAYNSAGSSTACRTCRPRWIWGRTRTSSGCWTRWRALHGLYRTVSYLLAQPVLSEPGAAGTDPKLLEQQADIARRLAVPLGQDEPTTRASWRLSRELAEAVLAVEPCNKTAQEALEDLALSEGIALYSDPHRSEAYVATLRDLADQLRDAYDAAARPARATSATLVCLAFTSLTAGSTSD